MNRTILILLTMITLSLTGMAQDKDNHFMTAGFQNGRAWTGYSSDIKTEYLAGYYDHWRRTNKAAEKGDMPSISLGETSKALDAFYTEPANANIPILLAIDLIATKVTGVSEEGLQKVIEAARKTAIDISVH